MMNVLSCSVGRRLQLWDVLASGVTCWREIPGVEGAALSLFYLTQTDLEPSTQARAHTWLTFGRAELKHRNGARHELELETGKKKI